MSKREGERERKRARAVQRGCAEHRLGQSAQLLQTITRERANEREREQNREIARGGKKDRSQVNDPEEEVEVARERGGGVIKRERERREREREREKQAEI